MLTLELKPAIEARIRAKAAQRGFSVEKFIEAILENAVKCEGERPIHETATTEEWEKAFLEFVNADRPYHPPISDEALRRENIYTREDEML
jgi:plasmid stability protein